MSPNKANAADLSGRTWTSPFSVFPELRPALLLKIGKRSQGTASALLSGT
jgi:hypothetical protein